MRIDLNEALGAKVVKNLIGALVIVVLMVFGYFYQRTSTGNIKDNGVLTIGVIKTIDDGGEAFDMSVLYEYYADGNIFERKTEISHNDKSKFRGCLMPGRNCSGGFVWVLHSKEDPAKSLVNMSKVYKDTLQLDPPSSLDGFY